MADQDFENESRSIFAEARALRQPEPAPYLATRVLATLREREAWRARRALGLWKAFSFASAACMVVVASWIVLAPTLRGGHGDVAALLAPVGHAVVVRVELAELGQEALRGGVQVAQLEVELPRGVRFYSPRHQELAEASSVILNVDPSGKPYVPFAILGAESGTKSVRVKFLDRNHAVVSEKVIDIRFDRVSELRSDAAAKEAT